MLKFSLNNTDARVVAALQVKNERVMNALIDKMSFLMTKLQQKVIGEKLSGQVLERRSGILANSISNPRAEAVGTSVVGTLDYAGGPAWYGLVFERGRKAYAVNPLGKQGQLGGKRPHIAGGKKRTGQDILHFMVDGKDVFTKYAFIPAMTPHPFMAPALDEMRAEIVQGLTAALVGVLKS